MEPRASSAPHHRPGRHRAHGMRGFQRLAGASRDDPAGISQDQSRPYPRAHRPDFRGWRRARRCAAGGRAGSAAQRLGLDERGQRPRFSQAAFHRAFSIFVGTRSRSEPFSGARRSAVASFLRRDGRRARRGRRIPHAPARHFRRKHGRARIVRRGDVVSSCPEPRRAVFRWRCACRARRWGSMHQRDGVPGGRDPAISTAQEAGRFPRR